jgi:hypothetical protein
MIAQNTAARSHRATGPGSVTYPEFLQTNPSILYKADHPLDANEWLNVVEQKFRVYPDITDNQKVDFTGLQLQGPAGVWWQGYQSRQPAGRVLSWAKFTEAFPNHFILDGILRAKVEQFLVPR